MSDRGAIAKESCVLVTGATSGIGLATATQLAKNSRLIVGARNQTKAIEIIAGLPNPTTHQVRTHDFSQTDGIESSLTAFLKRTDTFISGFVHAAGLLEIQAARNLALENVRRQFNVNVFSALEIIRNLVRPKINKDILRTVVLVGSISARMGTPGFSSYSATKGALVSAARSLAVELAPRVRVNTVSPGAIETPGNRVLYQDSGAKERIEASYPLGEGFTQDVAAAISFLLSDDARWITGHDLVVDGGRTLV